MTYLPRVGCPSKGGNQDTFDCSEGVKASAAKMKETVQRIFTSQIFTGKQRKVHPKACWRLQGQLEENASSRR